mmetsp:Transcript_12655/g.16375  ORF Transcript_12655/g.16375 Transcript_12655/m.16375 type:complete len:788 (+) Transcript_12655:198-2561(+)|eukprot:CAMPEP_0184018086 /NCGR_PEP_ID=MMETSP0954-20121128/7929_1 /TAXON_ID=627963 /ORGANISM="Aplanochytrium sp, Strain PBS07" /LENGTH=787 /DNA_ID=CAMNT_0026299459 /DNA_START=147 /DNA_END=2510 /DNA_ORIENTATION=+
MDVPLSDTKPSTDGHEEATVIDSTVVVIEETPKEDVVQQESLAEEKVLQETSKKKLHVGFRKRSSKKIGASASNPRKDGANTEEIISEKQSESAVGLVLVDTESGSTEDSVASMDTTPVGFLREAARWCYAEKTTVAMMILSASLFAVTIYYIAEKPDQDWFGITVWRWTLYFALLFPSWLFARGLLRLITLCTFCVGRYAFSSEHHQAIRRTKDVELFWTRYKSANVVMLWSLLLAMIFGLCFSPNLRAAHEDPTDNALTEWERIYSSIMSYHWVFVLYTAGNFIVNVIEFKYLHSFSAKNYAERIRQTLMEEICLSALAGYYARRATALYPEKLVNDIDDGEGRSLGRRNHAVSQYVMNNKMTFAFSRRMHLVSDEKEDVMKALVKKIRFNVRQVKKQQRQKQIPKDRERSYKENFDAEVEDSLSKDNGESNEHSEQKNDKTIDPVPSAMAVTEKIKHPKRTNTDKDPGSSEGESQSLFSYGTNIPSSRRGKVRFPISILVQILNSHGSLDVPKCMEFLNPAGDEADTFISLDTLEESIYAAFRDRTNLIYALRDNASVTAQIKSWIWAGIMGFFSLLALFILGVNGADSWVAFTSVILGFSFVFGGAVTTAFDNFIFLYGTHPYDVGDDIFLGDTDTLYHVKMLSLNTTVLENFGAQRVVQNKVIRGTEPLVNLTRSKVHWSSCIYIVDADFVTEELIESLVADLAKFFEKHPDTYLESFRVDSYEFAPPRKIKLKLVFAMPFSLVNWGRSRIARSKAAIAFAQSLARHGATYTTVLDTTGLQS